MITDNETVAQIVEAINRVWREHDPATITRELQRYFAEDMVIVGPDLAILARGAEACVRSYAEFVTNASIDTYESGDLTIEVFGDVAIVAHPWSMTYSIFGRQSSEAGNEVFTFARRDGSWRAVWRAMLPR